jgi:hypothetical protein
MPIPVTKGGRPSIVIFDPTTEAEMNEIAYWRPTEPNVIQIEMEGDFEYALYRAPETVEEYADPDLLRFQVHQMIRIYMLKRYMSEKRLPDIEYEVERLTDLGMAIMSNYRIANIYLETQTVEKIIPVRETGRDVLI